MTEHIIIGIVSVIVLGIGAQWLAWRIRVPSILLLLIFGFVAGPVTGLLPPSSLQGDGLFAFVSLSIGIILFEGEQDLREVPLHPRPTPTPTENGEQAALRDQPIHK